MSRETVLFVDDEEYVLKSLTRQLRKSFTIETATSGTEALEKLKADRSIAVVVSDLRMPGMDGIALLAEVKKSYPDIIRIILTGHADMEKAIEAVNSGQVFRFLTKPCSTNGLATTITLALRQHQLVVSERELLNKTLKGSIAMLSEVLSLSNPRAFSKGQRIKNVVTEIAGNMNLKPLWLYEVAALVSQIGCIAVPDDILEKVSYNEPLTDGERDMYKNHPLIGAKLLRKIPRLETVAEMIENQFEPYDSEVLPSLQDSRAAVGAHILKAAMDYDVLMARGASHEEAISQLYKRPGEYNPDVLQHLSNVGSRLGIRAAKSPVALHFDELLPGMVAAEDILARNGTKIIEKDQEITWSALQGLQNFIDHIGIREPIKVWEE